MNWTEWIEQKVLYVGYTCSINVIQTEWVQKCA